MSSIERRTKSAIATLLLTLAPAVGWSQSPTPAPQPIPQLNLQVHGIVKAIARHPDGGIIFGGNFTRVNGQPRQSIARLRPDGTLDPDWNPSAISHQTTAVHAVAVDAQSGDVYVAGSFHSIGGQLRPGLAKLSASGSGAADPHWNPAPTETVVALAVDSTGAVYAGGYFTHIGGQFRDRIAKLASTGTGAADPAWNPAASAPVTALAVDVTDMVYAGGMFQAIGGQSRSYLAKLSGAGVGAADTDWNPLPSGPIAVLAMDHSRGVIYAGGQFSQIGGQLRWHIAQLSIAGSGAADPSWNPASNGIVEAIAVDGSGDVYASGSFSAVGGLQRDGLAKMSGSGTGAVDPTWQPSQDESVYALAVMGDGKLALGGGFTTVNDQARLGLAFFDDSGGISASVAHVGRSGGSVAALARQPDGGMVVGGFFNAVDGMIRNNLARVRPDGSIDPDWDPSPNGSIYALAADSTGAVYAGGSFTRIGNASRNHVAKLSGGGAGTVDQGWDPSANAAVRVLVVAANDDVYAGGCFTEVAGQPRRGLARLSGSGVGAADPVWNPSLDNGCVLSLLVDHSTDTVFIGGTFAVVGGSARTRLAKLSSIGVGAVDPMWSPSADDSVFALAMNAGGSLFVGGAFHNSGGLPRRNLAKLAGTGTGAADPDWNPSANSYVYALAVDENSGHVYVGGIFEVVAGQTSYGVAKLSGSGAGAADPNWHPTSFADYPVSVQTMAVDTANRSVYLGGSFKTIGGHERPGLAKLYGDDELIFLDDFD